MIETAGAVTKAREWQEQPINSDAGGAEAEDRFSYEDLDRVDRTFSARLVFYTSRVIPLCGFGKLQVVIFVNKGNDANGDTAKVRLGYKNGQDWAESTTVYDQIGLAESKIGVVNDKHLSIKPIFMIYWHSIIFFKGRWIIEVINLLLCVGEGTNEFQRICARTSKISIGQLYQDR